MERAGHWARTRAGRVTGWTNEARASHRSVDLGFRLADRDKRVAAGVLAGGVAYRMFFWLLSLSVLTTGAFGVANGEWLEELLLESGFSQAATDVVSDVRRGADDARWWLILAGTWLVMWTGYLGAKTLVLVHAAVWGVPAPPSRKPWLMSLTFSATALSFLASIAAMHRVHEMGSGRHRLLAAVLLTAIPLGMWLVVSTVLPKAAVGWRDLVPGALVIGLGVQAFYRITAVLLLPKMVSATELYGLLGIMATALFLLYVLGRLIIAAATLNVALCELHTDWEPLDAAGSS